jgi:hypothetical protein
MFGECSGQYRGDTFKNRHSKNFQSCGVSLRGFGHMLLLLARSSLALQPIPEPALRDVAL